MRVINSIRLAQRLARAELALEGIKKPVHDISDPSTYRDQFAKDGTPISAYSIYEEAFQEKWREIEADIIVSP